MVRVVAHTPDDGAHATRGHRRALMQSAMGTREVRATLAPRQACFACVRRTVLHCGRGGRSACRT